MSNNQLSDFAEVWMGQSPPGITCNTEGIGVPLLNGPSEFGDYHPNPVQYTTDPIRMARSGDLLFCVRGSTGRMNWADREYAIGRGIAAIRHKQGEEFKSVLRAIIEYHLPELLSQATGSVFSNVTRNQIEQMRWDIDGLTEQRTIAHILGTLDDKIELNRRMNETLEGIARALFRSWFIDFDPVRAKAEGRQPFGMDEETAALFPDQFEDSELGEIPKGWTIGTIGDISTNVRDQYDPTISSTTTMPYIGLEHMPKACISLYDWSVSHDLASGKFKFQSFDVLFGKLRPYFHKVGLAPLAGICSTDILVIRPIDKKYLGFLSMLLSSNEVIDYADRTSKGTKMPRTSWADLAIFKAALPPVELIQRFTTVVSPLLQRIINNIYSIKILESTRDSLLPGLISGEIRVNPFKFGFGPEGDKVGEV